MKISRFILSSIFVSASFVLMALAIIIFSKEAPDNVIRARGLVYLTLIPYFIGALINKDGFWERSVSTAELLRGRTDQEKRLAIIFRVLRLLGFAALVVVAIVAYRFDGFESLKDFLLLVLGVFWGGTIARAWFIFRQGSAMLTPGANKEKQ